MLVDIKRADAPNMMALARKIVELNILYKIGKSKLTHPNAAKTQLMIAIIGM